MRRVSVLIEQPYQPVGMSRGLCRVKDRDEGWTQPPRCPRPSTSRAASHLEFSAWNAPVLGSHCITTVTMLQCVMQITRPAVKHAGRQCVWFPRGDNASPVTICGDNAHPVRRFSECCACTICLPCSMQAYVLEYTASTIHTMFR